MPRSKKEAKRRKKRVHVTKEAPLPVPIANITGEAASSSTWYCYTGKLQGNSVLVTHSGDMDFLYRMGFFGKGSMSRSDPSFSARKQRVNLKRAAECQGVQGLLNAPLQATVMSKRNYLNHCKYKALSQDQLEEYNQILTYEEEQELSLGEDEEEEDEDDDEELDEEDEGSALHKVMISRQPISSSDVAALGSTSDLSRLPRSALVALLDEVAVLSSERVASFLRVPETMDALELKFQTLRKQELTYFHRLCTGSAGFHDGEVIDVEMDHDDEVVVLDSDESEEESSDMKKASEDGKGHKTQSVWEKLNSSQPGEKDFSVKQFQGNKLRIDGRLSATKTGWDSDDEEGDAKFWSTGIPSSEQKGASGQIRAAVNVQEGSNNVAEGLRLSGDVSDVKGDAGGGDKASGCENSCQGQNSGPVEGREETDPRQMVKTVDLGCQPLDSVQPQLKMDGPKEKGSTSVSLDLETNLDKKGLGWSVSSLDQSVSTQGEGHGGKLDGEKLASTPDSQGASTEDGKHQGENKTAGEETDGADMKKVAEVNDASSDGSGGGEGVGGLGDKSKERTSDKRGEWKEAVSMGGTSSSEGSRGEKDTDRNALQASLDSGQVEGLGSKENPRPRSVEEAESDGSDDVICIESDSARPDKLHSFLSGRSCPNKSGAGPVVTRSVLFMSNVSPEPKYVTASVGFCSWGSLLHFNFTGDKNHLPTAMQVSQGKTDGDKPQVKVGDGAWPKEEASGEVYERVYPPVTSLLPNSASQGATITQRVNGLPSLEAARMRLISHGVKTASSFASGPPARTSVFLGGREGQSKGKFTPFSKAASSGTLPAVAPALKWAVGDGGPPVCSPVLSPLTSMSSPRHTLETRELSCLTAQKFQMYCQVFQMVGGHTPEMTFDLLDKSEDACNYLESVKGIVKQIMEESHAHVSSGISEEPPRLSSSAIKELVSDFNSKLTEYFQLSVFSLQEEFASLNLLLKLIQIPSVSQELVQSAIKNLSSDVQTLVQHRLEYVRSRLSPSEHSHSEPCSGAELRTETDQFSSEGFVQNGSHENSKCLSLSSGLSSSSSKSVSGIKRKRDLWEKDGGVDQEENGAACSKKGKKDGEVFDEGKETDSLGDESKDSQQENSSVDNVGRVSVDLQAVSSSDPTGEVGADSALVEKKLIECPEKPPSSRGPQLPHTGELHALPKGGDSKAGTVAHLPSADGSIHGFRTPDLDPQGVEMTRSLPDGGVSPCLNQGGGGPVSTTVAALTEADGSKAPNASGGHTEPGPGHAPVNASAIDVDKEGQGSDSVSSLAQNNGVDLAGSSRRKGVGFPTVHSQGSAHNVAGSSEENQICIGSSSSEEEEGEYRPWKGRNYSQAFRHRASSVHPLSKDDDEGGDLFVIENTEDEEDDDDEEEEEDANGFYPGALRREKWQPCVKMDPYPVKEDLHLHLEEAFFLSYGLGCLSVLDQQGKLLDLCELWTRFCALKSQFLAHYVAYHFFRSRGWVPKPGLKFGCDFVLYREGPPFFHGSYSVLVCPVQEGSLLPRPELTHRNMCTQAGSWTGIAGLNRISEHVAKELMLCYVIVPAHVTPKDWQTPDIIARCKVKEVVMSRWVSSKEREVKDEEMP